MQTCKYSNCLATQQLTKIGCAKVGGPLDEKISSISSGSSERPVGQKKAKKQQLLGQRQKIWDAERKEERGERRKRHDEVYAQMTTYGGILKEGQKTLESVAKALTQDNVANLERMLKCTENPERKRKIKELIYEEELEQLRRRGVDVNRLFKKIVHASVCWPPVFVNMLD